MKHHIIPGLTAEQAAAVCSRSHYTRIHAVENGWGLPILINDAHSQVRAAVAERGYGLDDLIRDRHWRVRATVARNGYGLTTLVSDKVKEVRDVAWNMMKVEIINQLKDSISGKNLYYEATGKSRYIKMGLYSGEEQNPVANIHTDKHVSVDWQITAKVSMSSPDVFFTLLKTCPAVEKASIEYLTISVEAKGVVAGYSRTVSLGLFQVVGKTIVRENEFGLLQVVEKPRNTEAFSA